MTRSHATTPLVLPLAVALALSASGCTDTCAGPSCESTWPTTLLVGHVPNRWPASPDPFTDATSSIRGVASLGVGWQVSAHNGRTLVAQPDAQRVVAIEPPFGNQSLADIAQGLVLSSLDAGFGTAVAQTDDWAVVGAPQAALSAGTVSIYRDLPATGVVAQDEALRLVGATPGDRTGMAIELCADMDGDGLSELLISAPTLTDSSPLQGGVWWVLSSSLTVLADGSIPIADVGSLLKGVSGGDRLGSSILCTLDVDDDGLKDAVIGAPLGASGDGYIQWMSGQTLREGATVASGIVLGSSSNAWFGSQLSAIRTVDDVWLAVSASGANNGAGQVLLYNPTPLFTSGRRRPNTTLSSLASDTRHLGRHMTTGDIDGDGLDELIVGASDSTVAGDLGAGQLFVWSGQDWPRALIDGADHVVEGRHAFERVGRWTSLADTDNNGTVELYMSLRAAEVQ